jgi:hypothetical protein
MEGIILDVPFESFKEEIPPGTDVRMAVRGGPRSQQYGPKEEAIYITHFDFTVIFTALKEGYIVKSIYISDTIQMFKNEDIDKKRDEVFKKANEAKEELEKVGIKVRDGEWKVEGVKHK